MQLDQLKRRKFITLLGGAAAVWPLAAPGRHRSCRQPRAWSISRAVVGNLVGHLNSSSKSANPFPQRSRNSDAILPLTL